MHQPTPTPATGPTPIDPRQRPFTYSILLYWSPEDDAYVATVPEFPQASAVAAAPEDAVRSIREAVQGHIALMLDDGVTVPPPGHAIPTDPGVDGEHLNYAWEHYAARLGAAALPRDQFAEGAMPPGYAQGYTVAAEGMPTARLDIEAQKWLHPGDPASNGPRTPEVMTQMRREATAHMEQQAHAKQPIHFTCDGCGFAPLCPLVYDSYNTQGDCLWEK